MPRSTSSSLVSSSRALTLLLFMAMTSVLVRASTPAAPGPISAQDVDGHAVAVNGKGHYTVVMYTNPDLEDESRKMTLALDPFLSLIHI